MSVGKKQKARVKRALVSKAYDPAMIDAVLSREGTLFPEKVELAKAILSKAKLLDR